MVFTYVFPLALMTTYPAEALLGKLEATHFALVLAGGIAFAAVARAGLAAGDPLLHVGQQLGR